MEDIFGSQVSKTKLLREISGSHLIVAKDKFHRTRRKRIKKIKTSPQLNETRGKYETRKLARKDLRMLLFKMKVNGRKLSL